MWKGSEGRRTVDCQHVQSVLMAYLKQGLSPAHRQAIDDHLAACDACTRSVQQAQILESELRLQAAHHNPTLSAEASARIHERVYVRMKRGLIAQRAVKLAGVAVAVVAVALAAVALMALWQGVQPDVGPERDLTPESSEGTPTLPPTSTPLPPAATALPPTDTPIPATATATEPPVAAASPEPQTPAGWVRKADMPGSGRIVLATGVLDGKIYLLGGRTVEQQGETYILDAAMEVQVYDPVTDAWAQTARMPDKTAYASASVVNGRMYLIGGRAPVDRGDSYAYVGEYDPATDTWTEKASLPTPRDSMVTAVVDGKIYAIGGFECTPYGCPGVDTVEMYDPATDTWTEKASMPDRRAAAAGGVVDGRIYVIGGKAWTRSGQTSTEGPGTSSVYEYDPTTDTWAEKAPMPIDTAWAAAVAHDGQIYVFGGSEVWEAPPIPGLFVYDPATDTWAQREDMPFAWSSGSAEVVHGKAYLIGGSPSMYPLRPYLPDVWEYDLRTAE